MLISLGLVMAVSTSLSSTEPTDLRLAESEDRAPVSEMRAN